MDSIILEIQREAMDLDSGISNLLRKSLVIARKLKIKDFERWVNLELHGYKNKLEEIPDYREVRGDLKFLNPIHGWRPVIIDNEELAEIVSTNRIHQSITEIEYLLESDSDNLIILLPQNIQNQLSKMGTGRLTKFQVSFGKSQAQQIIDSVRNIILDWSMQLEEDGILGEGMSFSEKEKKEANSQNYTVNNFYGETSGFQIQQHTQDSTQTPISTVDFEKVETFITDLKKNLTQIGLSLDSQKAAKSEVKTISNELQTEEPKRAVIKQSLKTLRSLLEGVTGSILAQGLLYQISQLGV